MRVLLSHDPCGAYHGRWMMLYRNIRTPPEVWCWGGGPAELRIEPSKSSSPLGFASHKIIGKHVDWS